MFPIIREYRLFFEVKNNMKKKIRQEEIYTCRRCGKEKSRAFFFKCSIDNQTMICKDCISDKYEELLKRTGKKNALFICCHYLDIPFYAEIADSLKTGEGIGEYVRQYNIKQYNDMNFEDSMIKYPLNFDRDYSVQNERCRICGVLDNIQSAINTAMLEIKGEYHDDVQ